MHSRTRELSFALLLCGLLAASSAARADSGGGSSSGSSYGSSSSSSATAGASAYEQGRDAALAGQYDKAIRLLKKVVAKDNRNADAFNMLGYSYRKKGDYRRSFENYERALTLDPEHKGAHEYIGQAYVEQGNLPKAREHLARLDKLCWLGCPEFDTLKAAIDARASGKPRAGRGDYRARDDRG